MDEMMEKTEKHAEEMIRAVESVYPGIMEKLAEDWRVFWRADDYLIEQGDNFTDSMHWIDGAQTEESTNGLCCTYDVQVHADTFYGRYLYAVTGSSAGYGVDEGEHIISNHEVLAVYDRKNDKLVYVNTDAIWPVWLAGYGM